MSATKLNKITFNSEAHKEEFAIFYAMLLHGLVDTQDPAGQLTRGEVRLQAKILDYLEAQPNVRRRVNPNAPDVPQDDFELVPDSGDFDIIVEDERFNVIKKIVEKFKVNPRFSRQIVVIEDIVAAVAKIEVSPKETKPELVKE